MACGFRLWEEMFREEEQIVLPHVCRLLPALVSVKVSVWSSVCKDGSMLRKYISEKDQIRHPREIYEFEKQKE